MKLLFLHMSVKNRVPQLLTNKCRHFFDARWPNEEINPYKLRMLTGLAPGTCSSLINDESYVPTKKVLNRLCEVFDLDPADFFYREGSLPDENS